ncbi:MAG: hypothetical protein JSR29_18965 [Nitrospira sp.]|nr:hypothetical protein [Nitrospira sp.]
MNPRKDQHLLSVIALFALLASCSPGPQAGGGIGGTGQIASIASGPITGFGSIFVSGAEYDTTHTSMMIDGKPGSQSDLQKGMIVRVDATLTERSGTKDLPLRAANTLLYEDTLEGFVQSVAADGSHLVVLGQTVTVTPTTSVDASIPGGTVLNLVPGRDLVEISGFVIGEGSIRGTLIRLKTFHAAPATPDYQVKGFITHHKPDQRTFEIGSLTIDYKGTLLNDLPGQSNSVWDGLLVDVIGTQMVAAGGQSSGLRLTAMRVRLEGLGSIDSEEAVIEGFVTRMLSPDNFFLGNVQVVTNAGTIFEGGTRSDILVGGHLEVHGTLVGGIVKATKVEVEDADLKGLVTQVLDPSRFVIGTVQVLTSSVTVFTGGNVNDVVVGAHVEVYGSVVDGTVNATKVEFEQEARPQTTGSAVPSADHTVP